MNPFALSGRQLIGLWANIAPLEARKKLDSLWMNGVRVSSETVYNLTLAATGSKQEAEKAFRAHRRAELKSGEVPL